MSWPRWKRRRAGDTGPCRAKRSLPRHKHEGLCGSPQGKRLHGPSGSGRGCRCDRQACPAFRSLAMGIASPGGRSGGRQPGARRADRPKRHPCRRRAGLPRLSWRRPQSIIPSYRRTEAALSRRAAEAIPRGKAWRRALQPPHAKCRQGPEPSRTSTTWPHISPLVQTLPVDRNPLSDSGKRMYIITASRMISGEVLKYRNGFLFREVYEAPLPGSSHFTLILSPTGLDA